MAGPTAARTAPTSRTGAGGRPATFFSAAATSTRVGGGRQAGGKRLGGEQVLAVLGAVVVLALIGAVEVPRGEECRATAMVGSSALGDIAANRRALCVAVRAADLTPSLESLGHVEPLPVGIL